METPVLEGPGVRLEPMTLDHLPALEQIAFDPVLWRYMVFAVSTPDDLRAWVQQALDNQAAGTTLPWVTIRKAQNGGPHGEPNRVIGCTRFLDLDLHNRTTELGSTWLIAPYRGTRINTEAKLLQLTYAFETLGLLRVSFKVHASNQRSQSSVKSIGGIYEGTFRNHLRMPDGSQRDSAWFSIIDKDWPEVKDMLTRRLKAPV
jgi:RimJ/RimL family protein N-acetyltransferase